MNMMTLVQDGAAWAWHTSLVMAVPGTILLAFGVWRGFPSRWRMFLAAALLLRLLLPWVPELPGHPGIALEKVFQSNVATPAAAASTISNLEEEPSTSLVAQVASHERRVSWQLVIAGIWGFGVAAVGLWLCGSHWLIRRWIARDAVAPDAPTVDLFRWGCKRMGLQKRVGLVAMPGIATAAVCGWLKPIVLVPSNLRQTHTEDEIRGILLHELAHVRRCDVLWSWLGLAACALHWFNPLAWLALRRFHADRELDCDRMALAKLTEPQRNAYAPALFKALQCPAHGTSAALVPFFRHRHEIHTRILTIMKPTKSLAARLAALTIIPVLSVLTLTTAGADEDKKPGAPEETTTKQRDGEGARKGPRDGEVKKDGPRDGEGARKEARRDGDRVEKGASEVERTKHTGEADVIVRVLGNGENVSVGGQTIALRGLRGYLSEHPVSGALIVRAEDHVPVKAISEVLDAARDNGVKNVNVALASSESGRERDGAREGEANLSKTGAGTLILSGANTYTGSTTVTAGTLRVGTDVKEDAPDGKAKGQGQRDGEVKKTGPRDGEARKSGPRDGEVKKEGTRDGDKPKGDAER